MIRALAVICFLSVTFSQAVASCQCQTSFSACNEVAGSDVVFIGTVQSIDPPSLNLWTLPNPSSVRALNDAYTDARLHPSAAALTRLKDTYLKEFPELAVPATRDMQDAKTRDDVTSLFYSVLDRGMRIRFKVKTLFKRGDDDDSPKKDAKEAADSKEAEESLEVWTPFGDCGYDFQTGETYLVYASDDDEGSKLLATGKCTRTRRLSDAGEDLAYLYFYKDHPEESARLEGFTTTNELYQLGFEAMHDPETIQPPVSGIVVELQSDRLMRHAESDRNGRFVFDGLGEGEYKLSAFAHGYPLNTQLLAGPRRVHIDRKSCARQFLLLPKKDGN